MMNALRHWARVLDESRRPTARLSSGRSRTRAIAASCSLIVAMALVAGCGGSSGTNAGEGGGNTVKLGSYNFKVGDGKLKIAYFTAGTNNLYLQAGIKGAQDEAKKLDATLTVYDGAFDAQKQFQQIQNATASGKFNAFMVEAVSPTQECAPVRSALQAGILVSVINQPLCGRETNTGNATWEPGTVDFVGGTQTKDSFQEWWKEIIQQNPGPQKVALLTGPDLSANTKNTDLGLKLALQQTGNKDFNLVSEQRTDYSLPQGFAKAQTILQANPDLTIFAANYTDLTKGIVKAAQAAGRLSQIKIYDYGGQKWSVQNIKSEVIQGSGVMLPYTEGQQGIADLGKVWQGKQVPRYNDLRKSANFPGSVLLTKQNVGNFKPEY